MVLLVLNKRRRRSLRHLVYNEYRSQSMEISRLVFRLVANNIFIFHDFHNLFNFPVRVSKRIS